jgi:hypothetical protein
LSFLKPFITPDFLSRFTVFTTTVKRGRHFSDLNPAVKRLFERFLQPGLTHPKRPNCSTRLRAPHDMARIIGRFKTGASVKLRIIAVLRSFEEKTNKVTENHTKVTAFHQPESQ